MKLRTFLLAVSAAFVLVLPASADDASAASGNTTTVPDNAPAAPASTATAPADDGTFESFRNFCVATHADAETALSAADKAGWMPIPRVMLASFPSGKFQQLQGRLLTTESSFIILIVARSNPFPDMDISGRVCGIAMLPAENAAALTRNAIQFAAVPERLGSDPSNHIYMWQEDKNGTHLEVDHDTPHVRSLAEKGLLDALLVRSDSKMAMAMFVALSK